GAQLIELGNEKLRWQQKMNYNIGMDADFFGRRLTLSGEIYLETTNGLISSVNLPLSNGFSSYIDNIGKLENKGFEARATYFIIRDRAKNFTWSVSATVMHNRNKIVSLSEALKEAQKELENVVAAIPNRLYKEGYATNTIWVVPSLGIDPSTGKEIYLDNEGNPTLTWSPAYLTNVGIDEPKYQGSVSSLFRYKNLSVNLAFSYRTGGQMYNSTLIEKVESSNYQYNMDARVYNSRWREPGDQAAFKGLLVTTPTYKTGRFVQNESTFQLRNVNVQYDFSKALLKKLGVQSSYVAANMADVFYISTVKRERGTSYPFSRQLSLTLGVVF
ncbi:MAG TPA: TonB-dependent receptor, partial [Parasegetibacter sp.]